MPEKTADYASYLLCVWKGNEDGKPVWRASLESTRDPERHNFNTVDELIVFLQDRFRDPEDKHKVEQDQPIKKEESCQ